jgi:hypothetical protein
LVDLVDLVYLIRRGVCGARTDTGAPARAHRSPSYLNERTKSTKSTKPLRSPAVLIWSNEDPETKRPTKSRGGVDE